MIGQARRRMRPASVDQVSVGCRPSPPPIDGPDADRNTHRRRRRARAQRLHPLGRAVGRRSRLGGDRLPARLGRGDGDRPRRPGQRRRAQPDAEPRGRARHRPDRRHHPPHLAHATRAPTTDGDRTGDVLQVLGRARHRRDDHAGRRRHLALLRASRRRRACRSISVPKTMDNDVFGTDYCIGFSTAVSRSVEAINALRTTVESHERIGVIELFGRRSGETALLAGFLAQVDRTVIAEVPADLDVLLPLLAEDKATNPAHYAMCVISEGATIEGEGGGEGDLSQAGEPARARSAIGHRLGTRDRGPARQGHGHPGARLSDALRRARRDGPDGRLRLWRRLPCSCSSAARQRGW